MPETLKFDHYEVLSRGDGSPFELGRGAMGITYKAFDTSLRIPVALKVINATYLNSESARQRFIREARSAAKLRNRHVGSVFHLGIEGNAYFYAMEFIDGETLEAFILHHGPLSAQLALQIAAQVARALNAAQPHGLVHRDIKPANLMLVREDDDLVVKVIDFGLAKSCLPGEIDEDTIALAAGGFIGTPHFASPEQLENRLIDVRSDIYSLGVTMWYMLSGQTPFSGPLPQVISDHLSKEPPFERLEGLPAPALALLAQMLEKDPARRPQSPNELRKAIEDCSALIGPEAAPADLHPVRLLEQTHKKNDSAGFEPGATVAERYVILEDLGQTNIGHLFHASDEKTSRDLRLLVLKRDLLSDADAYTMIEREVERTSAVEHPNLLRIVSLETVDKSSFIAMEWTRGFSLVELLRARRELRSGEVLELLRQAAAGVDCAVTAGLKRLDLALHQVFIHFAKPPPAKEELLRTPLSDWPEFTVKLNPLGVTRELSLSETWAGGQTIVGGIEARPAEAEDTKTRYIHALAGISYEMLGGALAPRSARSSSGDVHYTPLATLSEAGNDVLHRALDTSRSYPSASEFYTALSSLTELDIKRHTELKSASSYPGSSPGHSSANQPAAGGSKKFALAGCIAAVAAGAGIYFLLKPGPDSQPAPAGGDSPPLAQQSPQTEPATEPQTEPAEPEHPPATPARSPEEVRQDLLKAAVAAADQTEAAANWPAAVEAWLKIAAEHPQADVSKTRLEILIEKLRNRSEEVNLQEFAGLREGLTKAAQIEVVAAMAFLGDMLRKTDITASFNWYSAAAAYGHVSSLKQVGRMFASGGGTERDLVKAFGYFKEAADKGDAGAKYLLAECYLFGNGTLKDAKRALELLKEAADSGNIYAMDRLGTCYHQGIGVDKDFAKAFQLFSQASELGYAVATGNLGVLYINGDGMAKPDPKKAVELFQKGIQSGDGNCMYFYARCLEAGTGVGGNTVQARNWYTKAAEAGSKPAMEWCRKNRIPLATAK